MEDLVVLIVIGTSIRVCISICAVLYCARSR